MFVCRCLTDTISQVIAEPEITQPPQSAVRDIGGNVQLTCDISETYVEYFEWRHYQSGTAGRKVYSTYNNSNFNLGTDFAAERFHRVGQYGLYIRSLTESDGATYRCSFPGSNLFASANVFVVGLSISSCFAYAHCFWQ